MLTAIFDLDGTLADTSGDLLAAANSVFVKAGYDAPLTDGDFETALLGGRKMLALGAKRLGLENADEFVEAGYEPLLEYYAGALFVKTKLYANVREVLGRLQAGGWNLGVCTNKPDHLALPLLEALELAPFFGEAVIGARSLPVAKPHPEPLWEAIRLAGGVPERSVIIGDSETDYRTAEAAGTRVLLVDFDDTGIGERFPEAPLVGDFLALEEWLENWRGSL